MRELTPQRAIQAMSLSADKPATARHTEGPWRVVIDIPGYNESYRVEANDGNICVPCYGRDPRGIDLANAQLIAAAPEMYEAIQKFLAKWDKVAPRINAVFAFVQNHGACYNNGPFVGVEIEALMKALAKASGHAKSR